MAIFDMRTLHCGTANLDPGGATRIMLCVTFRNARALERAGHLRESAGFKLKYTLADVRHHARARAPFVSFGDGLPKCESPMSQCGVVADLRCAQGSRLEHRPRRSIPARAPERGTP